MSPPQPALNSRLVPLRNAAGLCDRALREGVDPSVTLAGTGLEFAGLGAADTRISFRQMITIHENLRSAPVPADFFLRTRAEFSIANYGILGYAMMSSQTLRHAIRIAMKYYRTAGPLMQITFDEDLDAAHINLVDVLSLGPPIFRQVVEDLISTFPLLLRLLLDRHINPTRLELTFERPVHADRYRDVFGVEPVFDAPITRFWLDPRILDLPIREADAVASTLLQKSCQELLDQIEEHRTFANQIRQILLGNPGAHSSAENVAGELNMSTRTLRRRLQDEDTTFQVLSDDVRARLAKDYLRTTRLSIQEIGELIGFGEATNFRRAFVRWTSVSPHQFRKLNMQ